MIKRIHWYIAKTVLASVGLVIAVLVSIDVIFTFVAQFHAIGHDGYQLSDAVAFVFLRLPSDLYLILPVCCFIGSLVGLGHLASKSELIAMRAAGISVGQICKGVMWAGAVMMLIGYLLAAYISPVTRHLAYLKKNAPGQKSAILVMASATWIRSGDQIVYIGKTLPQGRLQDIITYRIKDNVLTEITHAKYATVKARHWTLYDVTEMQVTPKKVTQTYRKQTAQQGLLSPDLLHILTLEPQDMPVISLYQYIQYREANDLDAKPYVLQLWMRIFQPLTILIMMLLAVPFVFGPLRSSSTGMRLTVSFVVGFAFYIASQFFGSFTLITAVPAFIGACLPSFLFGGLLLLMIRRIN